MYVFRKIWHVLCSCSTRFKIRPLALLPKVFGNLSVLLPETKINRPEVIFNTVVVKHFVKVIENN